MEVFADLSRWLGHHKSDLRIRCSLAYLLRTCNSVAVAGVGAAGCGSLVLCCILETGFGTGDNSGLDCDRILSDGI